MHGRSHAHGTHSWVHCKAGIALHEAVMPGFLLQAVPVMLCWFMLGSCLDP